MPRSRLPAAVWDAVLVLSLRVLLGAHGAQGSLGCVLLGYELPGIQAGHTKRLLLLPVYATGKARLVHTHTLPSGCAPRRSALGELSPMLRGFFARGTEDAQGCEEMNEHFCSVHFHPPCCIVGVMEGTGRDCSMERGRVAVPWRGSKHAAFQHRCWEPVRLLQWHKCVQGNQKLWKQRQHGDVSTALLSEEGSWECGASVVVLSIRNFGEYC